MWLDRKSLFAVLFVSVLAFASVSAGVRIRLREAASVAGTTILLGDVGDIQTDQAGQQQALAAIPLGLSPSGDAERVLTQGQIRRALERGGLDLKSIEIEGATEVRVKTALKLLDPQLVALSIQERLAANYPGDLFKLNSITITMNSPMRVPAGGITLAPNLAPVSGQPSGTIAVDVYVDKQHLRRVQVHVGWDWEARVPTASRALPFGTTLSEADCKWTQQKRKDIPAGLVLKAAELLGMRLRRPLHEGDLITQGVIASPKVVEKGDLVQLALRGKGFNILTTATAQEAGSPGEKIKLLQNESKKIFIGKVVGKNKVEITF